ncbi:lysozyme [Acidovorax sp.]|uniref:lysozyme n=1 Tax=Acidovorax sp. TaxID=1872122 RepID=UPI0025C4F0C9|nr:lysozyme [Acidovorax sp.]MBW8465487.1 lysozyme [Acidovorax sp.]
MNAKAKLTAKIGAGAVALAIPLVVHFEGYVPWVHRDPIGRLAACYGHDDQTMTLGKRFTAAECQSMLDEDLLKHTEAIDCVKRPITDGQKAAFLSFAFNVGNGAFCGSTLVRKANAGDMAGACAELSRWTLAGGKELPGLVRRRAAERAVCEGKTP